MAKERIKNLSLSEQRKKEAFRKILRDNEISSVNGIVYIIFAFLLGAIGVHNFYATYWKRGLVQLLLTLIAPFLLYFPLIFTSMWAEAELLFQNRDKEGRLFKGSRRKIWCLRFGSIVALVWGLMSLETVDIDAVLQMTDDVKNQEIIAQIEEL
jgi:TM2 domain-containing membrane protein YozV